MNKYIQTLTNSRGDVLPGERLQVVTSAGATVDIFADSSGTTFTDEDENVVNYATADLNGLVEFYWTPASGQVLQWLDTNGDLRKAYTDFAKPYLIDNVVGDLPQSRVTDLVTDLAAKTAVADLASTASDKGGSLVGETSRIGSTAYLKTISDMIAGLPFNVLSELPVAQREAVINGTSTYDAQPLIQGVLDDLPAHPTGSGVAIALPPGGLKLGSRLHIQDKIAVKFTGHSTQYLQANSIQPLAGYTDNEIIFIDESGDVTFDGVCIGHLGRTTVNSVGIRAYQSAADVDIIFRNGIIASAETGIKIFGRGLALQNYSLNALNGGVAIDWPDPLVIAETDPTDAAQAGHSSASGMRAYRFENGRCHAWAAGFFITNIGTNSANFMGAEIVGLYCDTNMRFWDGDMPYTTIDGVNMQALSSTDPIFDVDSCKGSSIRGIFRGQNDVPASYTREMGIFGIFREADDFLFDGYVERVTGRTIAIVSGDNFEINLRGRDLSLDGTSSPVQLSGTIGAATIRGGISTAGNGQEWVEIAGGATINGPLDMSGIRLTSGWLRDNYAQNHYTSILDDNVLAVPLNEMNGEITVHMMGSLAEVAIVNYKLSGTDVLGSVRDGNPLAGSATYDAPSITASGTTTTTVTVTGASVGDLVNVSFGVSLQGLVCTAYVSASNTVTIVLFNPTAGAIDLASTTVRATVYRDLFTLSSGATPTGTTGTDGKTNLFFVESSGVKTLYIENRRGGTRSAMVIQ